MAARFFPILFVFLWATGFIGAGLSMPYAEPFSFMAVRFFIAAFILGSWALLTNSIWPKGQVFFHSIIIGCLIHGIYLSAVFWAVHQGLPAGMTGLVAGLQPMITAIMAAFILKERVHPKQMLGLVIGFIGVGFVVWPKFSLNNAGVNPVTLGAALVAVLSISLGTVWQKRFGTKTDLKAGTTVQYIGAACLTAIAAYFFETGEFTVSPQLIFAMIWLVFAISVGAILALMVMIKEGAVSKVASLFYLVPASAAIMAYLFFGEKLDMLQIVGMAITTLGVALTVMGNNLHKTPSRALKPKPVAK